jgi:hypothetical protein
LIGVDNITLLVLQQREDGDERLVACTERAPRLALLCQEDFYLQMQAAKGPQPRAMWPQVAGQLAPQID